MASDGWQAVAPLPLKDDDTTHQPSYNLSWSLHLIMIQNTILIQN